MRPETWFCLVDDDLKDLQGKGFFHFLFKSSFFFFLFNKITISRTRYFQTHFSPSFLFLTNKHTDKTFSSTVSWLHAGFSGQHQATGFSACVRGKQAWREV